MIIPSKFNFNDAGRSTSKRPKQNNDCTVRAVAIAFNLAYDQAYDFLKDQGRKCSRGFQLPKFLNKTPKLFNREITKLSFPAIRGQERMNVGKFYMQFAEGTFIIRIAKHVAVVQDGILQDTFFDSNYVFKCVYNAWKII